MVKIEGNQIYSTLPYIGGGYNTFGNNDGMRFTGTISDYKVEAGKNEQGVRKFYGHCDHRQGIPLQNNHIL